MARLTDGELSTLYSCIGAVGGKVVPRAMGFQPGAEGESDVTFVKRDDYIDFMPAGDREGEQLIFRDLPGNQIHAGLAMLDSKLTPKQGLRRLNENGDLVPIDDRISGRTLLFVHGTFSNSESIVGDLKKNSPAFLDWARTEYEDRVISFDYATLSQQALASAMTLRRATGEWVDGPIDVICHSQGGLVTRFWLEALDAQRLSETRAVFVAGTLAGTSLAAPWALRRAMKALANVAWALTRGSQAAGLAFPFFGALASLIGLLEKSTHFLSKTPTIDAGVALVPGLSGMSQVQTNAELRELQASAAVPPGYFAITGDFQPPPVGWKFWERFFSRAANGASDLLFRCPNDLVVDTAAMTHLADGVSIPRNRIHHFEAGEAHVHHTNYFQQEVTVNTIRGWLAR